MRFGTLFALVACATSALPALAEDPLTSFQTIFVPPSTYRTPKTLYGREAQLPDGSILATWENYSLEPPPVYFPIFKSTDKGQTWDHISNITDTKNGFGIRYQPFIYVLPSSVGNLSAGTVLVAGNSIPSDLSTTEIDIYASTDGGATWSFVSTVATGGKADPDNGNTPVWEPFLLVYNNQLVCYYSDQRDTNHGQKLVHQVSSNGVTWGAPVDDVAYPTYTDRPGMTTVAKLPNGNYIMTYEYGGGAGISGYGYPIYYRISSSPLTFNSATGVLLEAGGNILTSSPYVVWSSAGGANGTIAVSAQSSTKVFINTKLGDANSWVAYSTPQSGAYARSLLVMDDPTHLFILSAGYLGGNNYVTFSILKFPNL